MPWHRIVQPHFDCTYPNTDRIWEPRRFRHDVVYKDEQVRNDRESNEITVEAHTLTCKSHVNEPYCQAKMKCSSSRDNNLANKASTGKDADKSHANETGRTCRCWRAHFIQHYSCCKKYLGEKQQQRGFQQ